MAYSNTKRLSNLGFVTLVVIYKVFLDIAFDFLVYPIYGNEVIYQSYGPTVVGSWFFGTLIVAICAFVSVSKKSNRRISNFVALFQLIFVICPGMVLYRKLGVPIYLIFLLVIGFLAFIVSVRITSDIKIPFAGKTVRRISIYLIAVMVAYVYIGLMFSGGLGRLNFDFTRVYEFRDDYIKSALLGMGYFVNWTAYVVMSIILINAYKDRNYFIIALVVFAQAMLFGMTSIKSFLFVPLFSIGMMFFAAKFSIHNSIVLASTLALLLLQLIAYENDVLAAAMLDRAFFVPAGLHNLFFDYFSSNPPALMAGSIFGWVFDTQYDLSSVHVVAYRYWSRLFSPNVGWIGDSYANFGLIGVIILGAVLAFILRIADGLVMPDDVPGSVECVMLGSAIALCSSGLGTVMLTHGLLFALFLLWIRRRQPNI